MPTWHGFTMQDARALPSTGFRPPFGLGRVTLERPALYWQITPKVFSPGKLPASNILVLAPNRGRAVLALIRFGPYADCGCAIIPDGAPDPLNSTRRFAGGTKTVPVCDFSVHVDSLSHRKGRAVQGFGEIAFLFGQSVFGKSNKYRSSRLRFFRQGDKCGFLCR